MAEYIEREALIEEFDDCFPNLNPYWNTELSAVRQRIRTMKAADVVEVKHGEWIKATPYSQEYCNQCGLTPKTIFGWLPLYCPNCGAKMDKKEGVEE